MYLNTEKKLEILQKNHSSKRDKNVAKGLLLRELGFKTGLVPQQFQAIAEDNLVTKNYEELRCRLPGVPRSTFLMVFSPDGKKVASTHGNHNVYVTDLTTGKNVNVLMGHPRTPWCIAFHPSSNQILASGCLGGQVRVWDLHGGSEVWTSHGQSVIASLAFHPTDRLLVIATYNELHFWDWSQPKPFAKCYTNNEKEKVRYVAFDPLGLKLVTGISNAPPLVSQWDRVGPAPMQTGPGTSQTLQGASSMHQPTAQRPPPAVPPPASETERRISVCYRTLVEQYDQLVQRYFDLMRPRSIPTTDRGTDPMDLESETGARNAEGSESSNVAGTSQRIIDRWRTSSRNSGTGLQSVYNEVLRIARRRSASTTTTPTNPTTTSNTTTTASGPSVLNQDSHSTRSSDTGQDVGAYCLRRNCAPRVVEQPRTFTPENPLRITASQSSAFRPRAPRSGEAERANSNNGTTSNIHDRCQQGRAERFSHLSSQNVGNRTSINRSRPFPDLGIRFGIQLLSRHIDNMQQLCRARLEILQLQQIRRVWEDLQRQIRSLHVAVRESGSSTAESSPRNEESGGHIPSVSQMMEQLARISDSEPGSGRKRPFRGGQTNVLNNFANKKKTKGNVNEPSTSNSTGNVKDSDFASSDKVAPSNPSTSQEQDIPELPAAETSTNLSNQTINTETKDNRNYFVSKTETEECNVDTGTNSNSTNFTTQNCNTNTECSSNQSLESTELKDLNAEHESSSNITDSSKSSNGRKPDKVLNSNTVNEFKSITEDHCDNLSAKSSSSNVNFHSQTLNEQIGQASTSHTSTSNNEPTQSNIPTTSSFRRFQQNQRSCASIHRINKMKSPNTANQIRRPWFLQSLAQSLRSYPRTINSRLQGRSSFDKLEVGCDRATQSSVLNKRAKRKKKKSKTPESARDNAHSQPECSSNTNKSEKCASSKEFKLNIEGSKMGSSVSNDNNLSNSVGPSTSTASEQFPPGPDTSAEPPLKIRKPNLKREADSTAASRDGASSSPQPSCQRRHGAQGAHGSSSSCSCSTCNQECIWQIIHRLQELVQQQRERTPSSRSIPNSRSYRHRSSGISRRLEAWRSGGMSRRIESWRSRERSSWATRQTGSDSDSNPESERRAPWPWERRTSADRLTTALQNELYEVERLQELSSNLNNNSVNQSELVGRGNPRYRARQVLTLMVDSLTQFFEENDMSDRTSSGALDERVYNLYTLLQLALELTDLLLAQLFSTRRELENQWVNRLRSPVALDVSDNQQTLGSRERRPRASDSYRLSLSNRRGVRHRQDGNSIGCPTSTETPPTRGRGWPSSRLVGWYSRPLPVAHTTSRSASRLRLGRVAANRSLRRRYTVPDPPSLYTPNEGGGEPRILMVSGRRTSVRVAVPSPARSPSPPRETWSYHGRVVYRPPEAQPTNPPPSDTFTVPTVQVNDVTVPESALNMQVPPPPRAHSPPPDVWNVIGPHQFQPPSGWVLRLGDVYFSEPPRPQSPPPSVYFPRGFTVSVNRSHQPGWRSQLLTPRAPLYDHEEILAMHADSLIRGGDAVIITDAPLSPNHRIQVWDFSSYKIPDISNAEKNLIVSECKIHNDASVDVSKDGKLLVTLLPAGRICVTTMLGVYSLQWESLGQCLYTTSFEQNAVSVSLSPACRHLLVGLASRRIVLPNDRLTVAQIFKLEGGEPGKMVGGRGRLCHMRDIEQSRAHSYSSLNCIRWAPAPGQGLVYGTNVGQLRVLR